MTTTSPRPIHESALLVIDVQESFSAMPERWARRSNPTFEANLTRLIAAYRAAGLPVFFFLHHGDAPTFRVGSHHVRLMDYLEPRPDEPILTKTTRNCFTSTDLQARLERLGVRRLVVTGIATEQCCETTARLAADLGYDVDFVTEATRTFPIIHEEGGVRRELGVEAIVERTEYALRGRFARIATVGGLIAELAAGGAPSSR
jgi:nicotinamidase-related amidase